MGLTGLSASGKWSTWSPGRFKIPEKDEDCISAIPSVTRAYLERPQFKGGFFMPIMSGCMMEYTCSNCHLVCHPDKKVRTARYKMLIESGVVIQEPNGTRRVVSPEEANEYLKSMPLERRKLYEPIPPGKPI
jgi:epoxyqueuosine reductase QueG